MHRDSTACEPFDLYDPDLVRSEKGPLDLFVRATQNNQYGNTHFVKANVGKTNREKYGISKDDLGQYSPILGNLRPYAGTSRPVADDDDLPEGEFKGF